MIEILRGRSRLALAGDVCQRGVLTGLYDDGWTDGALEFTIQPARSMNAVRVSGSVPEWWPEGSSITLEVDHAVVAQVDAVPGPFFLHGSAEIPSGKTVALTLRTTTAVHDPERDRDIGIYVSAVHVDTIGEAPFTCNICRTAVPDLDPILDPEGSLCKKCGSNIRIRGIAHLVGDLLFGKTLTVPEFPANRTVTGLGVSDSPELARRLKRALPGYTNTQFDATLVGKSTPFLDVCAPPEDMRGAADFVTCSEVLEHIAPPVQRAFDGLYSLLRPGGTLILTVPHTLDETVEHFPDLHEWRLEQRDSARVLVNRTQAGDIQDFKDLRFHGGGDDVLEMRVFGLSDIFRHLETAGFVNIQVREENVLQHGVFFRYNWGLPITAQRPSVS